MKKAPSVRTQAVERFRKAPTDLSRRGVLVFDEVSIKVPIVLVPHQVGYLGNAFFAVGEQQHRMLQSGSLDMLCQRHAAFLTEQPGEVIRRDMKMCSYGREGNLLLIMLVDIVLCSSNQWIRSGFVEIYIDFDHFAQQLIEQMNWLW